METKAINNGIVISSIFKKLEIRVSPNLLEKVKKNKKIKFIKAIAVTNNKEAEFLVLEENNEKEIIKAFFDEYLKVGLLQIRTVDNIKKNLRLIDNEFINKNIVKDIEKYRIKNDELDVIAKKVDELLNNEEDEMASFLEQYKYKSNAYDMSYVERVVLDIKISGRSPYIKDKFKDIPIGTRYSWFKNDNDIRILYSFFEKVENVEIFKRYKSDDVINFLKDIKNRINTLVVSEEYIRKIYGNYMKNIELIEGNYIKLNEQEEDLEDLLEEKNTFLDILIESDNMWTAFWCEKSEKISEIIRSDKEMILKILKNIHKE